MMHVMKNKDGVSVVYAMIRTIQENKEYLSEIDGAIGDGDHGVNMNKGFSLCEQRLTESDSLTSALEKLGNVLLAEIGGSMGPLYGTFFLAMKNTSEKKDTIHATDFRDMLHRACAEIAELGGAKVGDKTLMDTLIPAIASYDAALKEGKDFADALDDMESAAENGYKSTKNLVAKIGRASRLGERSKGVQDAGATSCFLLLQSMRISIQKLLESSKT